jgi:hypothetical protein
LPNTLEGGVYLFSHTQNRKKKEQFKLKTTKTVLEKPEEGGKKPTKKKHKDK